MSTSLKELAISVADRRGVSSYPTGINLTPFGMFIRLNIVYPEGNNPVWVNVSTGNISTIEWNNTAGEFYMTLITGNVLIFSDLSDIIKIKNALSFADDELKASVSKPPEQSPATNTDYLSNHKNVPPIS